jgi:uncharacterized protein HemX
MTARRNEPQQGEPPHDRRVSDRWHIAKDVPIALIAAVLIQTAGGIWWMAQLSSKIDHAINTINEFKTERYTREDARRDRELLEQKFQAVSTRDAELDRRINSVEARTERLERK